MGHLERPCLTVRGDEQGSVGAGAVAETPFWVRGSHGRERTQCANRYRDESRDGELPKRSGLVPGPSDQQGPDCRDQEGGASAFSLQHAQLDHVEVSVCQRIVSMLGGVGQ